MSYNLFVRILASKEVRSSYLRKRVLSDTWLLLSNSSWAILTFRLHLLRATLWALFFLNVQAWVIVRHFVSCAWVEAWTVGNVLLNDTRFVAINIDYLIIVIVSIEKGLYTVSSQEHWVLSHLLCVIVLPLTVRILGIEVVLLGWNKCRLYPFV